jgi:hypothetical protein
MSLLNFFPQLPQDLRQAELDSQAHRVVDDPRPADAVAVDRQVDFLVEVVDRIHMGRDDDAAFPFAFSLYDPDGVAE